MADVDAERNMLFGLLALKNNFIDGDTLIDAFGRWVRDPEVSLGQVLRNRGAIQSGDHDLLQSLAVKHLEKLCDDPETTMQLVRSIESVRDDLCRIASSQLQASLARVFETLRDSRRDLSVTTGSLGDPTSIGSRFRVLRPHAKGGLGQVSVALDRELDRSVALKEIQDRHADEPQSRARFVQEAEITGKLEHPGIIPVYGLGHDPAGRPFYAMRFIQGNSLREALAEFHDDEALKQDPTARASRLRELLRRFIDVCNAIAYAHSRGVLHRDLKPGNIMLGPYGETLVVDWGLAKAVGEATPSDAPPDDASDLAESPIRLSGQSGPGAETVPGSPIGTPGYASPEQLTGALDRLGPATDVYGLGATLYALLTGQSPVKSSDLGEVIRRVERGEITPPRSIDPTIPRPLEAICRQAMAADPQHRYPSVRALAEDVTRWLDDEPVQAYRESPPARAVRWIRRHRTAMIGAATAGLAGVLGLAAVAVVQTRAKAQSDEARKRSEAVLNFLKKDILAAARPEGLEGGLGVNVSVRKAVDSAEPKIADRFQDQPIVEAEVRNTLGTTYLYVGEIPLAIRQFERALELRKTWLGPDHHETLASQNDLTEARRAAGGIDQPVEMHEATLKQFEARVGPDHPDTLSSRYNLASAYLAAGRLDEAIALHETTLRQRESKLGGEHIDTLRSRNNLAIAYNAVGRTDDAIKLHESTLALFEKTIGPDHTETLKSRGNLAEAYRAANRIDDVIKLLESTLKGFESRLGPDQPDTITCRNNLAGAYQGAGRTDDAIKLHEANLKVSETKLGPSHPSTLLTRNNLGSAYLDKGRIEDAIAMHEANLKLRAATLGPDHLDTLVSRGNLARAYQAAGQLDKAIALLEQALAGFRAKVGPDHPYSKTCAQLLSDACKAAGRDPAAQPLLRGRPARSTK